jgi:hypothetical protein
MRSRSGATATTLPDMRNGCATRTGRRRANAVKPLFAECFARLRRARAAIAFVPEWDAFIQIRKTRRGNCW